MFALSRPFAALAVLGTAAAMAAASPAGALAATAPAAPVTAAATTTSVTAAGVPCTNVTQIGDKKVVQDLGMSAFTVRQYKGYCRTSSGSGWRNFASVYVWQQYHARGFDYRAYAGIAERGNFHTLGFVVGGNRQQLTYSRPVGTIHLCTRGWGKLSRAGSESAQGLTTERC